MIRAAGEELARALRADLAWFCGEAAAEEIVSRRWASVTFSGERHRLKLRLEGEGADEAAELFLDRLGEREFRLRGHVLADIAATAVERKPNRRLALIALEALTVEDC